MKIGSLLAEMEAKKFEVVALIHARHATSDIMKMAKFSKATIFWLRKWVADSEDVKDKPRSDKPTKMAPEAAKQTFKGDLSMSMSMSMLVKKKAVSKATVSTAVRAVGGNP